MGEVNTLPNKKRNGPKKIILISGSWPKKKDAKMKNQVAIKLDGSELVSKRFTCRPLGNIRSGWVSCAQLSCVCLIS